MNLKEIKKSIYKEAGIFSAIVAVFAGAYFYIDSLQKELDAKSKALNADATKLLADKTLLQERYKKLQDNFDVMREVQAKTADPGLYIDRQAVWDSFNAYRTKYFLRSLGADMQGIVEVKDDPKFTRNNYVAIVSNVTVNFVGSSDLDVYDMMDAMQKDLPGFSKIVSFTLNKKADINLAALEDLVKNGSAQTVDGGYVFKWYGLKAKTADNEAVNKYVPKKRASPRTRKPKT